MNDQSSRTYLACKWVHGAPDDPVMTYSELDAERWETRKVEVWPEGSKGSADGTREVRSGLGELPIPALNEISKDPQFEPRDISAEEFEAVWQLRQQPDAFPSG